MGAFSDKCRSASARPRSEEQLNRARADPAENQGSEPGKPRWNGAFPPCSNAVCRAAQEFPPQAYSRTDHRPSTYANHQSHAIGPEPFVKAVSKKPHQVNPPNKSDFTKNAEICRELFVEQWLPTRFSPLHQSLHLHRHTHQSPVFVQALLCSFTPPAKLQYTQLVHLALKLDGW